MEEVGTTTAVFIINVEENIASVLRYDVGFGIDADVENLNVDWGMRRGYTYTQHKAYLDGLEAGTSYFWLPFIEVNTIKVWGEPQSFTTASYL